MANTITGKIHRVYPTERKEINGKVYHERILVIDNTRYDQYTGEPGFSSFPSFSINGDEKCRELEFKRKATLLKRKLERCKDTHLKHHCK